MVSSVANGVTNFLNWVYSIPPDSFKKYEAVLLGFAIVVFRLNLSPATQAQWLAVGLAVYGVLEAVAQLSKTLTPKATGA